MNQQHKGDHAELRIAAELKRYGWTVLVPHADNTLYDIVAERDGEFVRLQVKSSRFTGTSVVFNCYNSANKGRSNRTTYTDDDIDGFGVYCDVTDECYWVPVAERTESTCSLNVRDADAKRPANEYLFEHRFV